MSKLLKWPIIIFIFAGLLMCAWSVLHNDIYYNTDIGRDFLIFNEIAAKKIVLIGPRADFQGLFHGILWHYLQMPAYLIGHGNPIVVGWWWILLTGAFIAGNYYIAKNLFDKKSAAIAAVVFSLFLVPYTQGFFHGSGAMLILPALFYFFVKYMQTGNYRYLIGHLFVLGMLVQFEIAIGIPFVILSTAAVLFLIIKKRNFWHVLCFGILVLFFSTFILTDLRHNFLQIKSILAYAHGSRDAAQIPFATSLKDRYNNLIDGGFNIFSGPFSGWNKLMLLFFIYAFYQLFRKRDKKLSIYIAFLYFYVGYYTVTLLHGGLIIELWRIPLSVLPLLIFISLHKYTKPVIFYGLLGVVLIATVTQNILFIKTITPQIGKTTRSWQFHLVNATKLFADAPSDFGFFIYSPDYYGYQDKYAMTYAASLYNKNAHRFEKRPITYVLIEPPPPHIQGLSPEWWIENQAAIKTKAVKTIKLDSGYMIKKYVLTKEDLQIPSKVTISDWLYFR